MMTHCVFIVFSGLKELTTIKVPHTSKQSISCRSQKHPSTLPHKFTVLIKS
jgi:hypothetical protein